MEPAEDNGMTRSRSSTSLTLTTGGVTLLGVLLSVGATVGVGIAGAWWVRMLAGAGTTLALALLVKFGSASGRGPLSRMAAWVIGLPDDDDPREHDRRPQDDGEA